jgi:bacterioferritin-associated ferredoxin
MRLDPHHLHKAIVGERRVVIVCSCNVLSDRDVRSAVAAAAPRSTGQVYGCLGCSAKCGRCSRTIRHLMNEVLGGAHAASCNGGARSSQS